MIAAAEDPFAIHLIIQSADKLLIDLSKRLKKPLKLNWAENIKDEYRSPLMAVFRETYNFLKTRTTTMMQSYTSARLPKATCCNWPPVSRTTMRSSAKALTI